MEPAKAERFARCLAANPRFADVTIVQLPRERWMIARCVPITARVSYGPSNPALKMPVVLTPEEEDQLLDFSMEAMFTR